MAGRGLTAPRGAPVLVSACGFEGDGAPDAPRVWAVDTRPPGPSAAPEAARAHARQLARAALAEQLAKALGCDRARLTIRGAHGQAPQATWQGHATTPATQDLAARLARTRLSIAHETGLSLIAWRASGAVGVDVQHVPGGASHAELLRTALLYLGPDSHAALASPASEAHFLEAFTRAWAAHEARLKCTGTALMEWSPTLATRLRGVRCLPLHLPDLPGWATHRLVGTVAWCDNAPLPPRQC